MFALTWLPEVLLSAGLKVAETPDWRNRGRAEMGVLKGVMCHHTATAKTATGNMPTLNLLINGRAASDGSPALAGPLAQLGLGRDGTYYVIAAGRANHAGAGQWQNLVDCGNSCFIGIEAENSGLADDPWPAIQLDAYYRGVAALLQKIGAGASMCCGHKEYATPPGRKIDPSLDMVEFRAHVAAYLGGKPAPPPIPAQDTAQRPTIRRGDSGAAVSTAQTWLGLPVTGQFDATMEAAVRRYQAGHQLDGNALVADGIIGPKSWNVLAANPVPAPAAPQAAPAAPAAAPAAPTTLPPLATAAQPLKMDGIYALTPDGKRFAQRTGLGFMSISDVPLATWLDSAEAQNVRASASQMRVARAVSANEGGIEAVNSYDNAFCSFGTLQWTAGSNDDPGELPPLLQRFKAADAAAYEDCFGNAGLDTQVQDGATTGYFTLNGTVLRHAADKEQLRSLDWAYRFWRAGHHPVLRVCEAELALARIARFYGSIIAGKPVSAWMTSELGVALLLDEHVNRPGHVPGTLGTALTATLPHLPADPAGWGTVEEHSLITAYIDARRSTSMTSSDQRAKAIMACVAKNALSDARHSYAA